MQKPRIWIALMVILSILSVAGNTTVTVLTGGLLSAPTAVFIGVIITSIPMIVLLSLDRRGLQKRGINPPSKVLTYIFAIILPAYIMTILYAVYRPTESNAENDVSYGEEYERTTQKNNSLDGIDRL